MPVRCISLTINWFTMALCPAVLSTYGIILAEPPDWVRVPHVHRWFNYWYLIYLVSCLYEKIWKMVLFCHRQHVISLCPPFRSRKKTKAMVHNVAARRKALHPDTVVHKRVVHRSKVHRRRRWNKVNCNRMINWPLSSPRPLNCLLIPYRSLTIGWTSSIQ